MPDRSVTAPYLGLSVVNMGPGEPIVNMAMVKTRVSGLGKGRLATLIHNFNDPRCARLPTKIAVSETINITFPIDRNCLFDAKFTAQHADSEHF
jgi:hypothetical protein